MSEGGRMRCNRALPPVLLAALGLAAQAMGADFFFRDGDRIVVVGDSITVQGNYVRYIENFLRTRFPAWKIAVRNAGINGHTAQMGMPYMGTDVLIWQPTAAVVNWGMNDGRRKDGVEYYKSGIVPYVDRLLAEKVRVVLCSNSPIDVGDAPGVFSDFNKDFHEMAEFAKGLAEQRGAAFVDQFHFCHTVWGENRKRETPVAVSDQTLAKHPSDYVHARAPGQLTMAYIILKTLGAPGEVSYASIDAKTGKAETRRCEVREFRQLEGGRGIAFVRADEASPCWIDDLGARAFALVPFQEELNRMTLRVTGLAEGTYAVKAGDSAHGSYTAEQLAKGVNLSENRQSPVCEPGRTAARLIEAKYGLTRSARDVMFFRPAGWLKIADLEAQKRAEFERRLPAIEKADADIAAAATPKPLNWVVERAQP